MYVYEVFMPIRIQNIILSVHYFWYGCNKTEVRRINTAQAWAALGCTDVHVPLDQLLVLTIYSTCLVPFLVTKAILHVYIYIRLVYSLYIRPRR